MILKYDTVPICQNKVAIATFFPTGSFVIGKKFKIVLKLKFPVQKILELS